MTENEEKRLQKIKQKMEQMKAQQQAIIARDKKRQQKERTRRLIQKGELAEKYLRCENLSAEEFEKLLIALIARVKF